MDYSTVPEPAVVNPSWGAIFVASVAFVLGPLSVMVVISHPLLGAVAVVGIGLSFAARRSWRVRQRSGQPGTTPAPWALAADGGPSDDAASKSDGERS